MGAQSSQIMVKGTKEHGSDFMGAKHIIGRPWVELSSGDQMERITSTSREETASSISLCAPTLN